MEDMAKLRNEGVRMWDQYQQECRSISHCMQSYSFASMMLPGALHYQVRLKGRVAHVLFA
jgi:hypothetical protein